MSGAMPHGQMLRVIHGEALAELRKLPAESVQMCVTSPPYWGLRDYGTAKWMGGNEGCDHLAPMPGGTKASTLAQSNNGLNAGTIEKKVSDRRRQFAHTCKKCGAMRTDDQLGLEPRFEEYLERLLAIFREVKRVLRNDGTLWLNLGDCYATGAGAVGECPGGEKQCERWAGGANAEGDGRGADVNRARDRARMLSTNGRGQRHGATGKHGPGFEGGIGPMTQPNRMPQAGVKPKDLMGMPWRVALALQADGWWLRSDIIWHKPNPMPESVRDRPTKAHEYLFLLSKSEQYFYDAEAIMERAAGSEPRANGPNSRMVKERALGREASKPRPSSGSIRPVGVGHNARGTKGAPNGAGSDRRPSGWHGSEYYHGDTPGVPKGKWKKEDKQAGARRMGEARDGARAAGAAHGAEFGATRNKRTVWTVATSPYPDAHFATYPADLIKPCILAGSRAGSDDGMADVLDPFGGSGTSGAVALELGRRAILIELNGKYLPLIERRCNITPGLALR